MVRYFKSLTSPLKSHDGTKIYRKHPQNLFIFISKWAFYPKLSPTDGRSTFFHCSNCTKVFLSLQCSHRLIYLSACAHISTSIGRNSRLHPLCVLCNIGSFDCTTFKARLVMNRHFANFDDTSRKPMSLDLFIIHDDLSIYRTKNHWPFLQNKWGFIIFTWNLSEETFPSRIVASRVADRCPDQSVATLGQMLSRVGNK